MKQFILMITLITGSILLTPNVFAASSEVKWTDYEKYRDIKSGYGSEKVYRENVFDQFEKHFIKLAATLPENQILKVEVTDLDLAGDTHLAGVSQMRVINERYPPSITFSYQLIDAKGKVVVSDEVVLRNRSFMSSSNLKYRNQALGHEKKMLDDWFKNTFKELVVSK